MSRKCSVFSRNIQLALAHRVYHLREGHPYEGFCECYGSVRCGSTSTGAAVTVEQNESRKIRGNIGGTASGRESIFSNLKKAYKKDVPIWQEPEEPYNFYNIKDKRESVPCPGFEKGDPRSSMSNRGDSIEDIDLDVILERAYIPSMESNNHTVQLKKACMVTNKLITVDVPVRKLTGDAVVSAILHNIPPYEAYSSVEKLYKLLYIGEKGKISSLGTGVLQVLEKHISLLARAGALKVREALMIALIYDEHGMLEPLLRDSLALALQSQLYALRCYDVAATVRVFGKYGSRYSPLLNTLGLVFYDFMLGGKTSVYSNGPPTEEILEVLRSYAEVHFPVKRVVDAGFGRAYEDMDKMTTDQLITLLTSFFTLSKDSNFVEMYTKVMAILFHQPLLFVDEFQKWAQEQLTRECSITDHEQSTELINRLTRYSPPQLFLIMRALSECKSEYLIQSVHSRIAFKRLWSENISKGIMPWQGPVVQLGDMGSKDTRYLVAFGNPGNLNVDEKLLESGGPSGADVMTNVNKEVVKQPTREDPKNADTQPSRKGVISYRHQIPLLYDSMLKMVSHTLGDLPHPSDYLKLIYDGNTEIITLAKKEYQKENVTIHECSVLPCYPFISTLLHQIGRYETSHFKAITPNELLPFFNQGGDVMHLGEASIHGSIKKWYATQHVKLTSEEAHVGVADIPIINEDDSFNEMIHCLSFVKCSQINNGIRLYRVNAEDLANAVEVINDYSRYSDGHVEDTRLTIANLYFRMLFVNVPQAKSHKQNLSSFKRFFENVTPRSLMLDFPHLPFTDNRKMMGETSFYQAKNGSYRYYKPSPLYSDLMDGRSSIYGLMMYVLSQKIMHMAPLDDVEDGIYRMNLDVVCTSIEHVLHPFHVTRNVSSNRLLKWSILYYMGSLNKVHNIMKTHEYSRVETEVELEDADFSGNVTYTETIRNAIDHILDDAVIKAKKACGDVYICQHFRHVANILLNVCVNHIQCILKKIGKGDLCLTLQEHAKLSSTVCMLLEFDHELNKHTSSTCESLIKLEDQCTSYLCQQIVILGNAYKGQTPEISASRVCENSDIDYCPMGMPDFVESLSHQMSTDTFFYVIYALFMAWKDVEDRRCLMDAMYSMTQVMYKRIPYMSQQELVRAAGTIVHLQRVKQHSSGIDTEDPKGLVAQMVQILGARCLEIMEMPLPDMDEEETISQLGILELRRCLL
ncbi:hypothetical protein BgAZ_206080 [Babesia gibsoni]|uniref:Uncharacterized protein n=1 Tax=Babesia gibsoni TaxID=33632 RepID=A0AAD8PEA9_BABGI|nr:hypothetical protein BgAZ_206080 [Babesia gibsoni]